MSYIDLFLTSKFLFLSLSQTKFSTKFTQLFNTVCGFKIQKLSIQSIFYLAEMKYQCVKSNFKVKSKDKSHFSNSQGTSEISVISHLPNA